MIQSVRSTPRRLRAGGLTGNADLARLYGVTTKVLNQAVKRNFSRFPQDFAFQLTREDVVNWSQFATSGLQGTDLKRDITNWSQIVTGSPTGAI